MDGENYENLMTGQLVSLAEFKMGTFQMKI
jgi:hypothetical protein